MSQLSPRRRLKPDPLKTEEHTMDEFRQFLKEYKWRVIGVAGGILLAVLIFTIGFWRTLLLTAITALCYFVGCILDKGGKEGLQEALSRLFRKN